MKKAFLLTLLVAFALALPASAAGPANAAPALQAPAVAPATAGSANAAPAVALPIPDAATVIARDVNQGAVQESTTCTVSVLCPNGYRFTCTGTVCLREPRCLIYCNTTGTMKCAPAFCP